MWDYERIYLLLLVIEAASKAGMQHLPFVGAAHKELMQMKPKEPKETSDGQRLPK